MFAHRYDFTRVIERCVQSVHVQLQFMEKMVEDGALQYFLERRISYDGIEEILNAVWEHKSTKGKIEDEKEYVARITLERLIAAIDEE